MKQLFKKKKKLSASSLLLAGLFLCIVLSVGCSVVKNTSGKNTTRKNAESENTIEQNSIEKTNKDAQNKLTDSYIQEAIDNIKVLSTTGQLNDNTLHLYIRQSRSRTKIFLERFIKLYKYVDLDSLLHQLWEIRTSNSIAYKNLNNAVMYWALDEEHPFKVAIRRSLFSK